MRYESESSSLAAIKTPISQEALVHPRPFCARCLFFQHVLSVH
jgi:hypothetical protein